MNKKICIILLVLVVLNGCGNTYNAEKMDINDYSNNTTQMGKTNVDVPLTITVNKEEYESLQQKNSDLETEKNTLKDKVTELENKIDNLEKRINEVSVDKNNENDVKETFEDKAMTEQKIFLSNVEELGTQGDDDFYCTFGTIEHYSNDNIGNYHNNGLIFIAKNKVQSILSKTYYNNGKYNTISGTVALTQETKDTESTAVFRIYGIKTDQSVEIVYTSKEFTNSIVPEQFNDIDISSYESIKVEVTFNDGYLTAIGLYDAYFN